MCPGCNHACPRLQPHVLQVTHRSSNRFVRNMKTIGSSGINQALSKELTFVTLDATFVVLVNALFAGYQDLGGVAHPGPLMLPALVLPALPFTILMPALSLLLVFRTNTGYARWNEARTLWGGLINNCRNVVRQSSTFFPDDLKHEGLARRMAAEQHGQSAFLAAWCPSSAPAPPQRAPGGSVQLGTPRARPSHWAPQPPPRGLPASRLQRALADVTAFDPVGPVDGTFKRPLHDRYMTVT